MFDHHGPGPTLASAIATYPRKHLVSITKFVDVPSTFTHGGPFPVALTGPGPKSLFTCPFPPDATMCTGHVPQK